jgi:hypothetical protein
MYSAFFARTEGTEMSIMETCIMRTSLITFITLNAYG